METSLKALLDNWKNGRSIVLKFLNELSEDDLVKQLPRKNQNTIRLQMQELLWVQSDFLDAIDTGRIAFTKQEPVSDLPKHELTHRMTALDMRLENIMNSLTGNETIDYSSTTWHGGGLKNIHEHIAIMIGHEQMHIGQIIAFCYAAGIHIPDGITSRMFLAG